MVVTTILGGMGNQLRAYATAYTVAKYLGQQMILDVSDYFGGYFRPYVLDMLSIPDHIKIYYPHREPMYSCPYGAPANFLMNFDGIINTDEVNSREELLAAVEGKRNIWLMGYGKLSFCTQEEKEELKQLFRPAEKSRFLQEFIARTEQGESVAIHIRRTDFIDNKWVGDETLKYYQAAINYLIQEMQKPEFYFFSDDIEWVKNALGYSANYHYISCFGGREADLEELFCMAACRHHVLTDKSTFGAWAAFLSWRKGGINIANGDLDMDGIPGIFFMDKYMVEYYCENYEADYGVRKKAITWDGLEKMLANNDNIEVIDYVDQLSLDVYGILPDMRERLMELKGIAHIQNNDVETALSVFDCLQQTQRDTFDFSFNYSVALDMAGRHIESLLYLGNALRINIDAVPNELREAETEQEREILRLIKEQRKRHYILLSPPCAFHRSMKGYYESIAIMLRNMGNVVTIVEIRDALEIDIEWNKNNEMAALYWMLNTVEKEDRTYNWDIDQYRAYPVEMLDGKRITVSDFLSCLAKDKEEVILLTHSIEGIRNMSTAYPLIFLDVISEWDVKKSVLREYDELEWSEIYGYASRVITERELESQWADKKVDPFVIGRETSKIGADDVVSLEDRITILEHYMRNEECLCGMLSVLKAVEELDKPQ